MLGERGHERGTRVFHLVEDVSRYARGGEVARDSRLHAGIFGGDRREDYRNGFQDYVDARSRPGPFPLTSLLRPPPPSLFSFRSVRSCIGSFLIAARDPPNLLYPGRDNKKDDEPRAVPSYVRPARIRDVAGHFGITSA